MPQVAPVNSRCYAGEFKISIVTFIFINGALAITADGVNSCYVNKRYLAFIGKIINELTLDISLIRD